MTKRDVWRVTSGGSEAGDSICASTLQRFNASTLCRAFTIVELLTVIAIIAILAAMLLPALSAAKVHAQKHQAQLQIADLVQQIQNYDSQYSRMPIPAAVQQSVNSNCFTFGGGGLPIPSAPNVFPTNSDIIAILMDLTNYPGGGMVLANVNYQKNPQQTAFLNARLASSTNLPGVGPDLNYRDPWGNPYVITMDVNDDNLCQDPFYSSSIVSSVGDGLISQGNGTYYTYHGNVMVWSAGPDKKIDSGSAANAGANKDNILSWQ